MEEEIYEDLKGNFDKTYSALKRDLARIRSGRASTTLLDNIRVDYYGQPTPIAQVASIQVPEPRMITVKPWEKTMLKDLERAIQQSDLGINPANDGTLIRLSVPPLTEERRKHLVKQVQQIGEAAKISARNSRRDANAMIKALQKDGDMSEDDRDRCLKNIQGMTDAATQHVDEIIGRKEAELMEV
ncbi:MAG: ribosome recycling factor [Myxococcota bacterium]|nr:ribosome recycling factor [Myxococcota bacterium]